MLLIYFSKTVLRLLVLVSARLAQSNIQHRIGNRWDVPLPNDVRHNSNTQDIEIEDNVTMSLCVGTNLRRHISKGIRQETVKQQ